MELDGGTHGNNRCALARILLAVDEDHDVRHAAAWSNRLASQILVTWRSDEFREWFDPQRAVASSYRQLTLKERAENRAAGLKELGRLTKEAHRDARERLESLLRISLDPLTPEIQQASAPLVYPDDLDTTTLQGYLGEVFAGLIAENFNPHDRQWEVPAFLFRTHIAAFQALERRRQLGAPATPIPGRTGDDALAFVRDDDGAVVEWLYGEAKCTSSHNSALIKAAHKQLSAMFYSPVDLAALIEIMESRADEASARWAQALRLLLFVAQSDAPNRLDMLVYVCGQHPVRRPTWLPIDGPSEDYTGERELEAVEVHLENFADVLTTAYPLHSASLD